MERTDNPLCARCSHEMVYEGVTFGKIKPARQIFPAGVIPPFYNKWREGKNFKCPNCKAFSIIETEFWIDRLGNKYNNEGEKTGRVDKWKPLEL